MKTKVYVILIMVFFACAAAQARNIPGMDYLSGPVPAPYLLTPTSEYVDLTGKDDLLFKWSLHESSHGFREYYDFRLYRGYSMVETTRIQKIRVPANSYQITLPASSFQDGLVYTWSLRQVYSGAGEISVSHHSFKVIKK